MAGEIEAALRLLPSVERVRVDVELAGPEPRAVVVMVTGATTEGLESSARTVVRGVLGPSPPEHILVDLHAQDPRERPPERDVPPLLAFALLGLGISLGVTAERLRHGAIDHRRRRRPEATRS